MFSKALHVSLVADGTTARTVCFAILVGSALAAFWAPLSLLVRYSFQHDHYSHIVLVPLIGVSLLVLERRRIFSHVETSWGAGLGLMFAGALLYWFAQRHPVSSSENDQLSIAIASLVAICLGGLVLCYGHRAFRSGLFPVLFLLEREPDQRAQWRPKGCRC